MHSIVLTSDAGCFKQPAYMRLFTPNYSIPSYAGRAPSVDKLNSYPAVLYVYANYAAFRLLGFSDLVSTGLDLGIHWVLCAIGSWSLWRLTSQQLPAILFLACSSQWLLPAGRPEELGMMCVLLALLAVVRGPWGFALAAVCLGGAGATSPGAAIVGTILVASYIGFQRGFQRPFWTRAVLLAVVSVMVAVVLYALYTGPYWREALEQHRALEENLYARRSLSVIVTDSPRWAISTLGPIACSLALMAFAVWRRPHWYPSGSTMAHFAMAAVVAIVAGLILNVALMRLDYDYRHITVLAIAVLAIATSWFSPRSFAKWGMAGGVLLLSLPLQRDIVRYTLAPLAREEQSVTYEDARQTIREIVPPDATVGGDGSAFTLLEDGRPYLLMRMIGANHYPDYVISRTWFRVPTVYYDEEIVRRLETEYEEVTPAPRMPQHGCALDILGWKIPIARGRCDWYVRIWKRKELSTQ